MRHPVRSLNRQLSVSSCESTVSVDAPAKSAFVGDDAQCSILSGDDNAKRRGVRFQEKHKNQVHASQVSLTTQDCQTLWYSSNDKRHFKQVFHREINKFRYMSLSLQYDTTTNDDDDHHHRWSRQIQDFYQTINDADSAQQATQVLQQYLQNHHAIPDEAVGLEKFMVDSRQRRRKRYDLYDAMEQIQQENNDAMVDGFADNHDDDKADTMRMACTYHSRSAVFLAHLVASSKAYQYDARREAS